MRLFNAFERTDPSPSGHAESTPSFLNRVDSEYFAAVRELLEQWFQEVPTELAADIYGRFWSKTYDGWRSAFWEMYLATVLRHLGLSIEYHANVPGVAFHPDFHLTRAHERLYVEATIAGLSIQEFGTKTRLNVLLDAINELESPDFFVHVQIRRIGSTSPSLKKLRIALDHWLASLDWGSLSGEGITSLRQLPTYTWRPQGLDWGLDFQAIPKRVGLRGRPGVRTSGGHGTGVAMLDDRRPIRDAIAKKTTRYGQVNAPLVVALFSTRATADEEDIDDALFGSLAVKLLLRDGEVIGERVVRQPDGIWMGPHGPQNTRVSAILVAPAEFQPWSVTRVVPRMWLNPWAQFPLDAALPWPCRVVDPSSHQLVSVDGELLPHELLGLPSEWPGPGDPFAKWHEISRTPSP